MIYTSEIMAVTSLSVFFSSLLPLFPACLCLSVGFLLSLAVCYALIAHSTHMWLILSWLLKYPLLLFSQHQFVILSYWYSAIRLVYASASLLRRLRGPLCRSLTRTSKKILTTRCVDTNRKGCNWSAQNVISSSCFFRS